MIIGICGKSSWGKRKIVNEIMELTNGKAIHLDIDKIGYKTLLLPEVKRELVKCFGNSIIKHNDIDIKKLGKIVFNSKVDMNKLTNITWKYMQKAIDKLLNDNRNKIVILDWFLLSISNYFKMCNIKIVLDIPYEIRYQRIFKADNRESIRRLVRSL